MTKMQLGRLPRIPGRPWLSLTPRGALPTPVLPVHNIELMAADKSCKGNDVWGDCVVAATENNRLITAAAIGITVTPLTDQECIANYQTASGCTTPPGPGLVIQTYLEWVQRNPQRNGGSNLLVFADVPISRTAIQDSVDEFCSVVLGVVVKSADEDPATYWDDKGAVMGGHGVAGGTETVGNSFIKSWGYMCELAPAYFANDVDEIIVLVWDFQWASLTYERQVQLVADYETLTGKPWTGPQPVPQYTPEAVPVAFTAIVPVRILDTRNGTGMSGAFTSHAPRGVQAAGVAGIPANAVALTGNVTVTNQTGAGYLAVTATPEVNPSTSTLNFPVADDRANAVVVGLVNGTLSITFVSHTTGQTCDVIFDVTGYFTA